MKVQGLANKFVKDNPESERIFNWFSHSLSTDLVW